jgi:hypothetical protein
MADLITEGRISVTKDGEEAHQELIGKTAISKLASNKLKLFCLCELCFPENGIKTYNPILLLNYLPRKTELKIT